MEAPLDTKTPPPDYYAQSNVWLNDAAQDVSLYFPLNISFTLPIQETQVKRPSKGKAGQTYKNTSAVVKLKPRLKESTNLYRVLLCQA